MAFHISSYGRFADNLKDCADLDGFVPQSGDHPEMFRWDSQVEWSKEEWAQFVQECTERGRAARLALLEWRENTSL